MAADLPAPSLTAERIRSAARHLEQDFRRFQSDLNAKTVHFKMVAEDLEKDLDSEAVPKVRQGLLQLLNCTHRLEHQCSALLNISRTFEAGSEVTDFGKQLDESTQRFLATTPFDPTTHQVYDQFNRAIWNIHHAGEAAPGQEQEEFVMISSNCGLLNKKCPLSGKPVIDLEDPVRSTACHHIYEREAVMNYITSRGRHVCKCAIPGCPKNLKADYLICDETLKLEIGEQRQRDRVAVQVADFTEVDLEDE